MWIAGKKKPQSQRSKRAGTVKVTLHAIEDPFFTKETGHASADYRAGRERLLAVDTELENVGTEQIHFNSSFFRIFDERGCVYETISHDSRCKEPRLVESYLPSGQVARGWMTFALPMACQPQRYHFFTGHLAGAVASFELGTIPAEEWMQRFAEAQHRWEERKIELEIAAREAEVARLELRASIMSSRRDELADLERRAKRALQSISESESVS